jgi:hypothetical protein
MHSPAVTAEGRGLQGRKPVVGSQVEAVVSLVEAPANHRKTTTAIKEAIAIRYGNTTGHSINTLLESPFAGKHPKLISKSTKAAAAEAAVTTTEAIAVADLEEANCLAAEFEALAAALSPWRSLRRPNPVREPLARVLARTRAALRVGGPLDQRRGNLDDPRGRCRRGD